MYNRFVGWLKSMAFLTIFLCVNVVILTACESKKDIYMPGTYSNEAEGYYSTLKVAVTLDGHNIMSIEILSHEEPEILSEIVFEELPPRIIKANSVDVDVISGATYTSKALINAVEKAIIEAKVDEE